ncbi:hypothetical protein [Cupriavidus sp. CuC1]|uniref:hypothetical protein n=1 Tax=Cupriavidus sp. CuC1 TaxID=3373131 RepID=UPI0037D31452
MRNAHKTTMHIGDSQWRGAGGKSGIVPKRKDASVLKAGLRRAALTEDYICFVWAMIFVQMAHQHEGSFLTSTPRERASSSAFATGAKIKGVGGDADRLLGRTDNLEHEIQRACVGGKGGFDIGRSGSNFNRIRPLQPFT